MEKQPVILWFRRDLRIKDNPALIAASKYDAPVIAVFIIDEQELIGSASKWWLHQSLQSLNTNLDNNLSFYKGNPQKILADITKSTNAQGVLWNRCYDPYSIKRDSAIKKSLKEQGIEVESFNSSLLIEPYQTLKDDRSPYKVFTPFYKRNYLNNPHNKIKSPDFSEIKLDIIKYGTTKLDGLNLMPKIDWYGNIEKVWQPGENSAHERLDYFLKNGIKNYKQNRNRPDIDGTSNLSPHIHFGEISVNYIWYKTSILMESNNSDDNYESFLREVVWRDFSYYLFYHFSSLQHKNFQSKFDKFPWQRNPELLKKWQKGLTGYPIVDAGMRQLWQTGFMHNRVRMIVASFLVKHLLIDWREGEKWFYECLVDADIANNSASWQWVAGCGADAAPYFRIFNPITQGQKFDPDGKYTKKYVPELSLLPNKYLFCPWEAPEDILIKSNISLGKNYPKPIVEHINARNTALEIFKGL